MSDLEFTTIVIGGRDRIAFLQGQMTQDAAALPTAGSLPAAWCSPKGRVLVTLRLIHFEDCVRAVLPASSVEPVTKRLQMYRLRADVSIEPDSAFIAAAFDDDATLRLVRAARLLPAENGPCRQGGGITVERPAAETGFVEVFAEPLALAAAGIDLSRALDGMHWRNSRIAAGLVDIDVATAERYTPHMLNLDRTGAVSFTKGCYTGQEVVARTENLGKVKRRINRYRLDGASACVGARLSHEGVDVGEVVNSGEREALAVVPVAIHQDTLAIGSGTAVPLPLPYALD